MSDVIEKIYCEDKEQFIKLQKYLFSINIKWNASGKTVYFPPHYNWDLGIVLDIWIDNTITWSDNITHYNITYDDYMKIGNKKIGSFVDEIFAELI